MGKIFFAIVCILCWTAASDADYDCTVFTGAWDVQVTDIDSLLIESTRWVFDAVSPQQASGIDTSSGGTLTITPAETADNFNIVFADSSFFVAPATLTFQGTIFTGQVLVDNFGYTEPALCRGTRIVLTAPADPDPPDGSTDIADTVTLQWSSDNGSAYYPLTADLYLGTTDSPPLRADNLTENRFTIDGLQPASVYYWQVVMRDPWGQSTAGPIWRFSTALFPPCPAAGLLCDDPHQLEQIRLFRDTVMGSSVVGRSLIRAYYRHAAVINAAVAVSPCTRALVRGLLTTLVPPG